MKGQDRKGGLFGARHEPQCAGKTRRRGHHDLGNTGQTLKGWRAAEGALSLQGWSRKRCLAVMRRLKAAPKSHALALALRESTPMSLPFTADEMIRPNQVKHFTIIQRRLLV